MRQRPPSRGSVAVMMVFLILITWVGLAEILLTMASQRNSAARMHLSAASLGLAEGGVTKALWEAGRNGGYKGEDDVPLGIGSYSVSVSREGGQLLITATGWIPRRTRARFSQTVRVVATSGGSILTWQKL